MLSNFSMQNMPFSFSDISRKRGCFLNRKSLQKMLFGCAVLETKSTRKLKNGQSLNQCVDLLAAHDGSSLRAAISCSL